MEPLKELHKLLQSAYVNNILHTHVSQVKPKGRFLIQGEIKERFWDLYCETIHQSIGSVDLGIAEKPQQFLPVIVDVDLKLQDAGDLIRIGLYSEDQLKTVVSIYQTILRSIVEDCTEKELTCIVLEKEMYTQSKNDVTFLKNGFHLHFPYIFLDKIEQEVQLIPRVKEQIKEIKLFQSIGYDDSGDVIDKRCCEVPWLLYGSSKENGKPYQVTKIYNTDLNEISYKSAFSDIQIFNLNEELIPLEKKYKFYLPRILSIIPFGRKIKQIKRGIISPLKEKLKKEKKASSCVYDNMPVEESLKKAKQLLDMIGDHRADNRDDWLSIGWTLYNISDGCDEGLNLWCEFSSRCDEKYDENECIHKWEKMRKGNLTIGTLKHYAKLDSPLDYKKLKSERSFQHIADSVDGSHNDVAKVLYEEFGDEFRCASVTNKFWYQFKDHHWEQIEGGVFLREKISGPIVKRYTDIIKKMYDDLQSCPDGDKSSQSLITSRIKQLQKMISNLKNANYKDSVMKECLEVFYDRRFIEKLDCDPYLIGFANGVYDLKNNIFRAGRPEDFLSKHMPINYVKFSPLDERVQEVHTFLEQVFPDKSVRKYFLDTASDVFLGGNHEKIVLVWSGDGDNGKTITQKFFELMLGGKLSIKLDTNVITGKKGNIGSACPELARTGGGVRLLVLDEPNGDECINNGVIKLLSGGDSYYARDLFEKGKEGREINPMFKIILICNKLPRIKNPDKAVWNRMRVIPFESTFCRPTDPAPETIEEQFKQKRFPMDKKFAHKIPRLVEPFAWILLEHRLNTGVRIEPEKVLSATEHYRKQNDIYQQFVEEQIIEQKDQVMTLSVLYNIFREWYKSSFSGQTAPSKNDLEEYFVKVWGPLLVGKKWKGYRQRNAKDDSDTITLTDEDLDKEEEELPL